MEYMCTKFGVDSSSRFPFSVQTQTHTDTQSHRQNRSHYSTPRLCQCGRTVANHALSVLLHIDITILLLLQPFYGPLDFVRDYLGEPAPER